MNVELLQNDKHADKTNASNCNSDAFLKISQQIWLDEQKKNKKVRRIFTKVKNKKFNQSKKNYFFESILLIYVCYDSKKKKHTCYCGTRFSEG